MRGVVSDVVRRDAITQASTSCSAEFSYLHSLGAVFDEELRYLA